MKIWKFRFKSNSFRSMEFATQPPLSWPDSLDGRTQLPIWGAEYAKWRTEDRELPVPDIAGFSYNLPAFNQKAIETLLPIIEDEVEFLPLCCEDQEWWIVNITDVVDCLDWGKAEVECFPSSGRLMFVADYQFLPGQLVGHNIFRLADEPRKFPFVSETFKCQVEECGITGCEFLLVWDSESSEGIKLGILS